MKKRGDKFSMQALEGIEQKELQAVIQTLEKVLKNIQERKVEEKNV